MSFLKKAVDLISNTKKPSEADSICPKPRSIYGVSKGKYLGEFFVYIESDKDNIHFLALPKMTPRKIPIKKFTEGLSSGVLEFQEILPKKVYNTCKEQYERNKKSNN
jgi:hypothetical protein